MAIHLTPALAATLQQISAETNRSVDELAESAISAYFSDYEEIAEEVRLADEEFERGESLPHEEVVALFAKRFPKV